MVIIFVVGAPTDGTDNTIRLGLTALLTIGTACMNTGRTYQTREAFNK